MKRTTLLLALTFAISAFAADSLHKQWTKTYAGIGGMFNKRDMATFQKTLDKDFVYLGEDGKKMDREAFIKAECDPIASAKWFKCTVKVTSIKETKGNVAVGYDWRYSLPGSDAKGKFTTVGREIGTDTWHKVDGRWLTFLTTVKKVTEKRVPAK